MQWLMFIVFAFGPGLMPNRAEAITLLNLGIKQIQLHEWETGLESVKKATEADPTFGRAHLTLGQIHREQSQHEAAAAEALGKASESNPEDYRAFHRLGRAYDELDLPKEADQAYRNCIRIQPRYDKCFVDLGIMYIDYGHENAAMQILETGVKVNDKSSTMWAGLVRAYARVDRTRKRSMP